MKALTIPALTILQPWASAIGCGAKRIETRSWSTAYRGPLLIHAGLSKAYLPYAHVRGSIPRKPGTHKLGEYLCALAGLRLDYKLRRYGYGLPLGALIAVAELVQCSQVEYLLLTGARDFPKWGVNWETERQLGDFSAGRYGWVLTNVRALPQPIPYRGRQGLFNVPADIIPEEYRP
jgi:hypothetical protein